LTYERSRPVALERWFVGEWAGGGCVVGWSWFVALRRAGCWFEWVDDAVGVS